MSAWDAGQDNVKDALKMKETVTVEDNNNWSIPYLMGQGKSWLTWRKRLRRFLT
jgi:hypothetical protein